MLDGALKHRIDPLLTRAATVLHRYGITANAVTLIAFLVGLAAAALIALGHPLLGLALLLASRLGDGIDGALARLTRPTDFGGLIDIVFDFAFYGVIPLAFILHDPEANAIAGALLLLAFYINGASFLAYAAIAEKRGQRTEARGRKSFYFTTGLAEATETYLAFAIFCLWPQHFPVTAGIFALICLYTAAARLVLAHRAFAKPTSDL
ncbi:CDP-alcohol phosphatidyltransferase family protein [Pseudohoeflea coraliihabitans]|uniref:CDP-alcohol phosphatidyltransferase family protein n=1 Tax=Pseudohoeflea coraliihabitans TaxID=2860393 RepID=A0ABS6WNE5_9HYPH|nr:CDP-alcohol phosphatidyltransferase family protein [Pseudohoeflea sp. DP4N28-3]MBW3097486.1 CDP-alcohol phosphatidyltransferase family protein [Pseudohoeflea sp. DP4N28-3]